MASIFNLFEISADLRDALSSHNLTVEVTAASDSTIRITLEYSSTTKIDQSVMVSLIRRRIRFYTLEGIEWIEIIGIHPGEKIPDWQVRFEPSPQTQVYHRDPFDLSDAFQELENAANEEAEKSKKEDNFEDILNELKSVIPDTNSETTDLLVNLEGLARRKIEADGRATLQGAEVAKDQSSSSQSGSQPLPANLKSGSQTPGPVSQYFSLRKGEGSVLLILGSILMFNAIAQKISEISSVSNFLSGVGISQILIVWIADGILLIFTTGLQSLLIDRFNRIFLMKAISITLAVAFLALRLLIAFNAPQWLHLSLFYLLSQQQFTFFPTFLWILGNDLFSMSEAKRTFPKIAAFGFLGNLVGIAVAALGPRWMSGMGLSVANLITFNILIYVIVFCCIQLGLSRVKLRKSTQKMSGIVETLSEGWSFIVEVPAFRFLSASLLMVLIVDQVVEFRFLFVSGTLITDPLSYQTFYSLFTLARFTLYTIVQVFIAQKIISSIDIKNILLISPISAMIGSAIASISSGLSGTIAGLVVQKLPLYSIDETARKTFQGFVPEERRGRVSLFMDSYLIALGGIAGALLTGLLILLGEMYDVANMNRYTLFVAILASITAIFSISQTRKYYDESLLNWRLKRRQKGKSVLDRIDF